MSNTHMTDIDTITANRRMEVLNAAVRPLVALAFAGAMIYGFIIGKMSVEAFVGIGGAVMGYYFQQRSNDKADRRVSDAVASLIPALPPDASSASTSASTTTTQTVQREGMKEDAKEDKSV